MPIGIGINSNVYIKDITQDTQSSAILITFDQVTEENKTGEFNYFESLGADKVVEMESSSALRLFAPNEPKADLTEEKRIDYAYNDVNSTKAVIEHIMKQFMASTEATMGMKLYDNTGLTQENFKEKIVQKPTLLAVHNNMARHFISGMRPFLNKTDQLFRLLLVRQSKDKPFATFRKKYLDDQPFMEPMDVPEDQSKLKFTKYELDNKLDSNEPAPTRDKADGNGSNAAPVSVSSVFG